MGNAIFSHSPHLGRTSSDEDVLFLIGIGIGFGFGFGIAIDGFEDRSATGTTHSNRNVWVGSKGILPLCPIPDWYIPPTNQPRSSRRYRDRFRYRNRWLRTG
jgi:hypothetical protein